MHHSALGVIVSLGLFACAANAGLTASTTSMNPDALPGAGAGSRHTPRNAAGDTVGIDLVVSNATDTTFLTNWSGIGIINGGTGFATNSVTSDEIQIDAVQSDLGGGLFEYRFGFRNSNSASGLATEFTPGGPVSINGGAPSPITQLSIQVGTLDAFNNNIDSILGAPLSIPDINGAADGNAITTIYFAGGGSLSVPFFAAIDGTGVDGFGPVPAPLGGELGDLNIVGYDVTIRVQYVPAPAAACVVALATLLTRRRRS